MSHCGQWRAATGKGARAGRPGRRPSHRVRGPAVHRAADRAAACKTLSVRGMPSRAPRRGAAARWGHRALPQRNCMENGPRNGVRAVRTRGVNGGCNGGRARCPYRAAGVMRVGNGGASREGRPPTIAPGARPCRGQSRGQSRGMQNSQRARDAKPRTAPMARRREPGGPAAKHRALPQRDRTTGHGQAAGAWSTATGHRQAAHRGGEPPRAMGRGGASREARLPSIAA